MNVLLVLNKDSEDWPDYIKSLFKSTSGPKIQTEYDTVLSRTKTPKSQSTLTVVIASPGHLEFLRENLDFNYKAMVPNPENAVLFLLGVKREDLGSRGIDRQPITGRFPDYAKWKQFDHDHAPEMVRHIEQRLKALKSKRPIPSAPKGFKLVPEVVRSEDPTAIAIFFDEPLTAASKVEVLLSDDDTGRLTIVIPAECRNPYSFTIVAPEHQEGEVNFRVLVDGKLAGTRQLKYASNVEKYNSLTQMYVHQLSSLCSLLTDRKISSSEIDNCLANIFDPESSADAAVPIEAFELLFGIYRYSANESSAVELPTMLHFAAKHGLKELTAKLTDLPDACLAHAIRNVDSKMPEDLARSHKHMSLSSFLENFREVNEGFEDLYVKCHGYINADGPANQDLGKHLKANSRLLEPSGNAEYIALYSSETPADEDDDDDLYYMYVPSGVKTKAAGEVKKTLASVPSSANQKLQPQKDLLASSSAATRGLPLSGDQQQLVDIMEMYKTKKCSMAEVESLFKQWKATSNVKSFRDKQEKLKKMKEDVAKAKTQENISTSQARPHKRDITPALPPKAR